MVLNVCYVGTVYDTRSFFESIKVNSFSGIGESCCSMAASVSKDSTDASAPKGEDEDLDVFVKELMENSKCAILKSIL
jgi:hypothetical protein